MGIIVERNTLVNVLQGLETLGIDRSEAIADVKSYIEDFVQDSSLDTKAYQEAKTYYESLYTPLLLSFTMSYQEMEIAQRKMLSAYDSKLSSDQVIQEELELLISQLDQNIWGYEILSKTPFIPGYLYDNILNELRSLKDSFMKELNLVIEFDWESPTFFDDAKRCINLTTRGLTYIGNSMVNGVIDFRIPAGAFTYMDEVSKEWTRFLPQWRKQVTGQKLANSMMGSFEEYLINVHNIDEKTLKLIMDFVQSDEVFIEFFLAIMDFLENPNTQLSAEYINKLWANVVDVIQTYVPLPQGTQQILLAFGNQLTNNQLSNLIGFTQGDGNYFTTKENSIQSLGGFMDKYDELGNMAGMDLNTKVVTFMVEDKEYRIQLWEGTYGWDMNIGGEIGIYYRSAGEAKVDPYIEGKGDWILYECVPEGEQLRTVLQIHSKKEGLIKSNDTSTYAVNGDHYWNTIFLENEKDYKKGDLYTVSSFTVEDDAFRNSFVEELKVQGMNYIVKGKEVIITWGN